MFNVKMIMTGSSVVQRGKLKERTPEKTWWDSAKDDMKSLGLSQKDAQFKNKEN